MWGCVGLLAVLAIVAVLFWLFDPNIRRGRAFTAELAIREPMPDDELFGRHFAAEEAAPDVPGRVRRLFALHTGYPADKLLPDDDLMFFWADLDMNDLICDIEREFGITIANEDAASVPACNIRAVSQLVFRKSASNSR